MADEGTLATTAQVLLAIGENASTTQVLEANTNIWVKFAESDMSQALGNDLVGNYATINAAYKQYLAMVAAHRSAFHAIQQDQANWPLSISESKLNVIDDVWTAFIKFSKDDNNLYLLGLSTEK